MYSEVYKCLSQHGGQSGLKPVFPVPQRVLLPLTLALPSLSLHNLVDIFYVKGVYDSKKKKPKHEIQAIEYDHLNTAKLRKIYDWVMASRKRWADLAICTKRILF